MTARGEQPIVSPGPERNIAQEDRAAKMAHDMAVHLVDVFSPNYSDERVDEVAEKIRAIMREEYERGDA